MTSFNMPEKPTAIDAEVLTEQGERQPATLLAEYELQAMRSVIDVYRYMVKCDLGRLESFDDSLIEDALEEWDQIAWGDVSLSGQGDGFKHLEVLEEVRPAFTAVLKLPKDASWNEILGQRLADFDEPIEAGLENNWSWHRVWELERANDHIARALKYGVDPDITPKLLSAVIDQSIWEMRMGTDMLIAETARRAEANFPTLLDLNISLGLPADTPPEEIQERASLKVRVVIARLYGKPVDDIQDHDVSEFLNRLE